MLSSSDLHASRKISVDTALGLFGQSITEPATCATYLVGCFAVISSMPGGGTTGLKTRPVSKHHGFFNLVVSFLTAPRSSTDFSILMSRLASCRCPTSPLATHLHEIGVSWTTFYNCSPATTLLFLLFSLTANVLHSAPKTRVAKGDNRNWPQSISNVVPFGFDSLVRAMGQWCIILPNPTPLMFLADALDLCGFPLFDAVTNSPTFLDLFIPSFRNTCTRLRSCRPPDKLPVPHLYTIAVFLFRVIAGRSSYNSIMMWTKGRELELYGILSDAVTICRDPSISPLHSEKGQMDMAVSVNIFHAFAFHFAKDVERPPDLHPDLAPASNPSEPVDPIVDLLSMQTDACYATGCKRSFQEVGRAFRKCGACTRVAYCSRECQITDWKDAEFPHRVVCRQLQIFNQAGGSLKTNDREALLEAFDYSLGDSVIGPLHAWFKARAARKEIEDLQAHLESPEIVEVEQGVQDEVE
ncbi:hypothetical protein B0H14DRAFT_2441425 [Mycena olivaceomarginata]|nr:hypothetical protein B0H14DRAFT_2441425 [Mycena olivaceomarginata]